MTQVRAVYNFDAQPNSGELSISVDEVLTVIKEGIDGGWLEGRNARGQHGLFPESYVIKVSPSAPPPAFERPAALPSYPMPPPPKEDDWGIPPTPAHKSLYPQAQPAAPPVYPDPPPSSQAPDDDDFDEWTEDDEELPEAKQSAATEKSDKSTEKIAPEKSSSFVRSSSRNTSGSRTDLSTDDESVKEFSKTKIKAKKSETLSQTGTAPGSHYAVTHSRSAGQEPLTAKQTIRMKNINRFSNFVKSGMEGFILSTTKMTTKPDERHEILLAATGPCWAPITQPYSCTVDKPKKESKLKGLKSFIAYSVTSSLSGIQVSRRYKHFDWLHEQMSAKYILTAIPPLPEKQVAGRYEEDLIEHRKNILQLWVNKVCRHPVLSRSDVWIHFLTCTDEKQWKNGKRKAEKDEYVGGNFLNCVAVPTEPLDTGNVEHQVESFSRCVRSLEDSVRVMYDRVNDTHKRMGGSYKSTWQKMAAAFGGLGHSFELDTTPSNQSVTMALKECAQVYHKIGEQHDESSKRDVDPLLDSLYSYKGLLASMPDIVSTHRSAMSKLHEHERLAMEGKVSQGDAEKIREKVDSVSYAVLSEIQFQHHERSEDFKQMMGDYMEKQAAFYMEISRQLSSLATLFRNA